MSNYPQGQFCWVELTAANWQQAKDFYCNLFGWTAIDEPIGDDMYYTMMQLEGKTVAAMFQMTPEQQAQGVMTNWLSYVAVDDADNTCAVAQDMGAQIIAGPHNVSTAGRMAIIHQPQGAVFAIWQGVEVPGLGLRDVNNTLCWNELATKSALDSKAFYHNLFQWECIDSAMEGMEYTEFIANDKPQGGMLEMTPEWGDTPAHWMAYFQVADCDAAVEKAQSLGAVICVPPTDIPEVGRFSVINDPQGATFSVIKLAES